MMTSNRLADLPAAACWWRYSWVDLADWPDKANTLVVVPVFGFCDWGFEAGLDQEERLGTAVLGAAWEALGGTPPLLVAPPQRFVLGPSADAFWAMPYSLATRLLREPLTPMAAAGFRRIVFFNTSPWNVDLVDAVARDARIDLGLQMSCVNLSGLGLDLGPSAPAADGDRWRCWLNGGEAAASLVSEAGTRLAGLFRELAARPPLPHGGAIRPADPAPFRSGKGAV